MNELLELFATTTNQNRSAALFDPCPVCRYYPATSTVTGDALVFYGSTATWVITAARQLEALARLREGWDSYGGRSLKSDVRKFALELLTQFQSSNLPNPNVVLCPPGTVQFEWHAGDKELDVELKQGGAIEYVKSEPAHEESEEADAGQALQKLRELTRWLQRG